MANCQSIRARRKMRSVACSLAWMIAVQPALEPCACSPQPYQFLAPPSEVQNFPLPLTESGRLFAAWVKLFGSQQAEKLNWFRFTQRKSDFISFYPSESQIRAERHRIRKTFALTESGEERLTLNDLDLADMSPIEGPLYVISDVHLAGKKEAGLDPGKYKQFLQFLDAVAREKETLVINGDFMELYLAKYFLYRHLKMVYLGLRKIKRVICIRGNHDDDLEPFVGKRWKNITFLDSMSLRLDNEIIHIEHGHKTDYPWNGNSKHGFFMKYLIRFDAWASERGIPIQLIWSKFANRMQSIFIFLQIPLIYIMHKRIRELRRAMGLKISPLWWPWDLIWDIFYEKKEPVLNCVIGHHHEVDLRVFHGILFGFLSWLTRKSHTRVKVHFTAGRWETKVHLPLLYTRILPDSTIEKLKVKDFLDEGAFSRSL